MLFGEFWVAFPFPLQQASCSYRPINMQRLQCTKDSHDLHCTQDCLTSRHWPALPPCLHSSPDLCTQALPQSCPFSLSSHRPGTPGASVPQLGIRGCTPSIRSHLKKVPPCQCFTTGSVASVLDGRKLRLEEEVAGLRSHTGTWHRQPEPNSGALNGSPKSLCL